MNERRIGRNSRAIGINEQRLGEEDESEMYGSCAVMVTPVLVLTVPLAANAVLRHADGRNCHSGYEAQSVSHHKGSVIYYMLSGTWSSRLALSIPGWEYAYKGIGTQVFADSHIDGGPSDLTGEISTHRA